MEESRRPETALVGGRTNRRVLLRAGAIGLGGLTLPELFRRQRAAGAGRADGPPGRARSAILLFLSGGPSQLDTWDPKPEAPEEIRGTFAPIATRVPGMRFTEHLPGMALRADRLAVVRSVHHAQANHPAAAYWMMVGSPIARPTAEAAFMSRADRPHPGAVVARLQGTRPGLPSWVLLPEAMAPNGPERAGQHAGFLGAAFDPYRVNSDPNRPDFSPGVLRPAPELTLARLDGRRRLLEAVDHQAALAGLSPGPADDDHARAFDLLTAPAAQRAFDLDAEPAAARDRYGRHVFGQSCLLARRLVEAGVRLVQVNWVRHDNGIGGQGYDTHRDHLEWSRRELMPPTDAAVSALIDDLDARGLLDETLVVVLGEFGRTPRFNKAGGRDHWPQCFSVVLAGGGIRGGRVHGASDRLGAYPASDPVTPQDLVATLYHCLGLDPRATIHDLQGRPFPLADGAPIRGLLA